MTKEELFSVQSFEDVCAKKGENPNDVLPYPEPKNADEDAANDQRRLDYVGRWLQNGFIPDYKKRDQPKWFPVFEPASSSGFVFLDSLSVSWAAGTSSGVRVALETEEISDFYGKTFIAIFERLITNNY